MAPLPRADDRLFSWPSFLPGCNEKYNAPIDGDVRSRRNHFGVRTRACYAHAWIGHRDEAGRAVAYRRMQAGHVVRQDLEEHRDWRPSLADYVKGQ